MKNLLGSLLLVLALVTPVCGQVLLTVDISNPLLVVVNATGMQSVVSDSTITSEKGFTLLGFLNSASNQTLDGTGSLMANGMSVSYSTAFFYSLSSGTFASGTDANIYNAYGEDQNFTTVLPAFSGTMSIDFSLISSLLPSVGWTGNVVSGDGTAPGVVLGTYSVVPEANIAYLWVFGGLLLLFARCRLAGLRG